MTQMRRESSFSGTNIWHLFKNPIANNF
jgi:hypothetical protein